MYRLRRIIEGLGHKELLQLKGDLEEGGFEIKRVIEQKIKQFETNHEKICSVCDSELEPYNIHNYTLIFGPDDFRKKASLCGMDCLQYFLENLKNLKRGD